MTRVLARASSTDASLRGDTGHAVAPCIRCGVETDTVFQAEGLRDRPLLPLHGVCASILTLDYGNVSRAPLPFLLEGPRVDDGSIHSPTPPKGGDVEMKWIPSTSTRATGTITSDPSTGDDPVQ